MRTLKVTGNAGSDQTFGPLCLRKIRPANVLAGAVTIKRGATVIETLPVGMNPNAAPPANHRQYGDMQFDSTTGLLVLNLANGADVVLVSYS